ncbi:MAG TPA: aquaporin [Microbacteriaceae bacterium]|nr:aquaporin [Microbacteriaceae bacterium]
MSEPVLADSDVALDKSPSLAGRLAAEVIGTALLVSAVLGAAFFSGDTLVIALSVGLAVLAAAYAVGHVSGGHFNPAVTIGAAFAGRFAWKDVLPYVIAQIVGGLIASSLFAALLVGGPSGAFEGITGRGFASNGFDAHSANGFSLWAVLGIEIVITFLFLIIILGVTDRRAPTGFAPLAIGLALAVFHIIAIPVSNASLNPARSIATAVWGASAEGAWPLVQLWAFIVAPLVGAILAGVLYRPLLGERIARTVKIADA